jgi:DNA-binding IclR family transcriptional regulator
MPNDEAAVGSIARAARVLDALVDMPEGAALADVVARTSFSKTTAHRVLAALQDVDYVAQDPEARTYRLGARLGALARSAAAIDMAGIAYRGMRRLAEATGDTVFLSVPEGPSAVCVAREVGAYPIRTLTLDRGDRRPLGVGGGALALYCAMPASTRAAVNRANAGWLAEYGFDAERLERAKAEYDRVGYAMNAGGVVAAMSAVGLPVVTAGGRLAAALAVGAINERMDQARLEQVVLPALREEAARLAARLSVREPEADK